MNQNNRNNVVKDLCHLFADTYTLYTKTQYFHWNITGELFFMLHEAFEKQYKELAEAIDVLAERIRALGQFAPGTFKEFQEIASIKLEPKIYSAQEMVKELLQGHEHLVQELEKMIKSAGEEGDEATMDLMIQRQAHHQKRAWMLRSSLGHEKK
jgi:starvation-inducible DNA-binding protein